MTAPKTGTRASLNAAANAAKERRYSAEHDASTERAMDRGRMPRTLAGLLRWYAAGWEDEVPDRLHKSEVYFSRPDPNDASAPVGGSKLGTKAHTDPFRRYLENVPSETDEDGWYVRPMHAALVRLSRRYPMAGRHLFAVSQAGYDWRGVALRRHWTDEEYALFLMQVLAQLWMEYRPDVVRLV